MNRISTLRKQLQILITLNLAFLISLSSFSQCGTLEEDFNSGTAGFTGTTTTAAAFGYKATKNNGELRFSGVTSGSYSITSTTYQLGSTSTASIDFGFTLSGSASVTAIKVNALYNNANGTIVSSSDQSVSFTYSSGKATICTSMPKPSDMAGTKYQLIVTLTATGNGSPNTDLTFDNYYTSATKALTPLPVEFLSLTSKKLANSIELTWNVAHEVNVARYEIQRGTDDHQFITIGTVTASGKSVYNFTDAQPIQGAALYRIKNIDIDGTYKYSKVLSVVSSGKSTSLRAYPTSVQNKITLEHSAINTEASISIATIDGRLAKMIKPVVGTVQTNIDVTSLQPGMYIVRFNNGTNELETLKFVKQ
ncbi:MAG: T9SS type A sorting domain-containing protein [Flavisolibacter sp.]|nr:T9SS type A sorting domain-containing protein [Flavisolibacter sp.]